MREFTLDQNQPGEICRRLVTSIAEAYDEVMNPLLLPLAFTATQATDYAKIEREAKGYHSTMKAEAESLGQFITSARSETEKALAAVKEQVAEAGVATNAQIFIKDSEMHGRLAMLWLKATVALASATLLATIVGLITALFSITQLGLPRQYNTWWQSSS